MESREKQQAMAMIFPGLIGKVRLKEASDNPLLLKRDEKTTRMGKTEISL
jgi:hypothetical protein